MLLFRCRLNRYAASKGYRDCVCLLNPLFYILMRESHQNCNLMAFLPITENMISERIDKNKNKIFID